MYVCMLCASAGQFMQAMYVYYGCMHVCYACMLCNATLCHACTLGYVCFCMSVCNVRMHDMCDMLCYDKS